MDKKFLISLMVAIFCLVIVVAPAPVSATDYSGSAYVNVTTPVNGEEYYSTGPFNLSITTFTFMQNCTGYLFNGTGIAAGTNVSVIYLKSQGVENTSWTNETFLDFAVSNGEANRWFVTRCENATDNNKYWSNTSAAPNTGFFTINEFADYSVANVSVINITANKFSNDTVYSSMPGVNITLNRTAATCYWINDTNTAEGRGGWQALTNNSGSRLYHGNSSASAIPGNNSQWGTYYNTSYYCTDAYGNKSWSNSTGYNVTSGAINSTSGWLFWKYDTISPQFSSDSWTISNATSGGNYVNLTFNVTDNTTASCGAFVIFQDLSETQITGGSINTSVQNGFCFVNITHGNMTVQGNMTIYAYAIDGASTAANSSTTREFIMYNLKADSWNMITLYQNMTLQQIGGLYTNITYVSIWNNPIGYKNFTTYTVGSATNALITINGTVNATYLYVDDDIKIVKRYQSGGNLWLQNTTSVHSPGWNIVGLDRGNFTINQTIYMTSTIASDEAASKTTANVSLLNITFFSYYNHTLGRYCSAYVGYTAYSCPGNVTNVYLPSGAAVWIQTNKNVTINVTSRGDT